MGWLSGCKSNSSSSSSEDCPCEKKCDYKRVPCNVKFLESVIVKKFLRVGKKLTVDEDASICGKLEVHGETSLGKNLTISGNANVGCDANISGNANVCHDLNVNGSAKIKENVAIGKDLKVNGNATFCQELKLKDDLTVNKNLHVKGGLYLNIVHIKEGCEYLVKESDHTVLVSAPLEVVLPDPSKCNKGQMVIVKNLNSECCIKVLGHLFHVNQRVLSPNSGIVLQNDGCSWYVLADVMSMF